MTEEEALRIIARDFPPVFVDLWNGRDTPFQTTNWSRPRTYFLGGSQLQRAAPALTGLTPLLEQNGEAIIGRLPDGRFVRFYYEDGRSGDAAVEVLGGHYQAFVLSILLELAEFASDEDLAEHSERMQFKYTAEFVAALSQTTGEAIDALRERVAAEQ